MLQAGWCLLVSDFCGVWRQSTPGTVTEGFFLLTCAGKTKYVDPVVRRYHHHVVLVCQHRAIVNLARRVADGEACQEVIASDNYLEQEQFVAALEGADFSRLTSAKDPEEHCFWLPRSGLRLRPHIE